MIISVEDGLTYIIKELRNRGYEVYIFSDGKASDIYIYSQNLIGLSSIYNSINPIEGGSFLLNADNMTITEIINCINNRVYSPIFK